MSLAYNQAPTANDGFELIDGKWAYGVSAGVNDTYQTVVAHAGGTQAAAFQLSATATQIYVKTVTTTGDSVKLPYALAGSRKLIYNAGAQTLDIYGQSPTNKASGTVDTINGTIGSTAYTLATGKSVVMFSPANGIWAALLSA